MNVFDLTCECETQMFVFKVVDYEKFSNKHFVQME